jgi:peptidoglycan/xylan/chitin deacetylase (PgdA/CDA1 family)
MAKSCVGLIFHGIGVPKRDLEPGEGAYWITEAQYHDVLDQICALPDPSRIRISFDDGNLSDLEIGLPGLQERGLTADFFVLSGRIGKAGSLNIADIRALQAAGMGIGSHGVDHRAWSKLEPTELRAELDLSRATLENICDVQICSAAIPFGAYNSAVLRALKQAGYTTAYSSDGGSMMPDTFLRPRSSVRKDTRQLEIANILGGKMPFVRRLRRLAGMIRKRVF